MLSATITQPEAAQAAALHKRAGLQPNALGRLKAATGLRYDAPVSAGRVRLVISHCEVNAKGFPIFNSRTVLEEVASFSSMESLLAHCEGMLSELEAV